MGMLILAVVVGMFVRDLYRPLMDMVVLKQTTKEMRKMVEVLKAVETMHEAQAPTVVRVTMAPAATEVRH